MIELGKAPVALPDVEVASEGALRAGTVYVGGSDPELPDGLEVVLETAGGRLELSTTAYYDGEASTRGTYLAEPDYEALGARDDPRLRLYGAGDSWDKALSGAGILVLAPALLGLVMAIVGVVFTIWGESPATITAALGALTALVAAWGARGRFGFKRSPGA